MLKIANEISGLSGIQWGSSFEDGGRFIANDSGFVGNYLQLRSRDEWDMRKIVKKE